MRRRFFAYGTLVLPEVVGALIGRVPAAEPAALEGFVRGMVHGRPYPAIRERPGAITRGLVYEPVSSRELRLLDRFEGSIYARRSVRVRTPAGRALTAEVYVLKPRHRHVLGASPWDAERFAERHLAGYVAHCTALRRGFRGGVG
jgi:gamma-glutamylcyclotransferase (GGCT)/AIG2-like uncharacterized protein YtfP